MNQKTLKEYILFAVVTVLVGLLVCEIICSYYPEMEKYHSGDNKNICISVLAITGLILRYILSTRMGKDSLYTEVMDVAPVAEAPVSVEPAVAAPAVTAPKTEGFVQEGRNVPGRRYAR